ncbi:MAG: tetratricopeptide repeat protein [Pseudomonadota bacterium]
MQTRLQLFGAPSLEHRGAPVVLPFERRSQLLALLALRRAWVGRAELAAMLWPDQVPKLAYANLRKTLFRLQTMPWGLQIESQGGALRFDADTDVAAFELALRETRIDEALVLRRGELLAGFDDDANDAWSAWLHFERDRLRSAWRGAALERLGGEIDPAAGIELSARLLEVDPLDEAALRAHLALLSRAGQGARARQVYREFVARLADELGLVPSAELQALHDALGSAAGARPPNPRASVPEAVHDAGFVGRSVERQRIAELLSQEGARLLCLIGPGGMGKTRLARRALLDLAPVYPEGTSFVPLEDVATAGELAARIARELGLTLRGRGEPMDQVGAALGGRRMLLVLDNFEQLVAEARVLEVLLKSCQGLKLIVTSRVRLGLAMEQLLPLEGLPCPEAEDQDRLEAFDAVRLFVTAAQRVEPALVPAAEAASIVEICRQVEGLPLALELAAAWTRVLSCAAIATELRQGIELLRAVDTTQPARHASIELVFEQSWQHLTVKEREALAALSVFRGGFTAEAARAATGAGLAVLSALADKSLLRKDGARLALHPLVQQLASARLGDGARAKAQSAHAAYFAQLLAHEGPAVGAGDRLALQRIDAEFENCRQAWTHAVAHAQAELVARSMAALVNFCEHRGRSGEALPLMQDAVEAAFIQADPALQASLLANRAQLEYRLDRYAEAQATAAHALQLARRRDRDRATRLQALNVLATCALRTGRFAEARVLFTQVLGQGGAPLLPLERAAALDHLALAEKSLGNYDEALRLSLESLVEHRRLGDLASVALCLNNLAALYMARQDYAAAAPYLRESLAISERVGLVSVRAYVLSNLVDIGVRTGDLDAAEGYIGRTLDLAQAAGNRALLVAMKLQASRVAIRRGDAGAARVALAAGLESALPLGMPSLNIGAAVTFAELLDATGEAALARRLLAFAIAHPLTSAPDRDEISAQLAQWGRHPGDDLPWPGVELNELLQRIVAEAGLAHAPLISLLRG